MELMMAAAVAVLGFWAWHRRPHTNLFIGTKMSDGWLERRHEASYWHEDGAGWERRVPFGGE